jgi:hypothetical protein
MPYAMRAQSREIYSMPLSNDMDDHTILLQNRHSEETFTQQICDQFDALYSEAATSGGRILTLVLHPWVIGQPYRIGALERALSYIMTNKGVWSATGSEIVDAFTSRA